MTDPQTAQDPPLPAGFTADPPPPPGYTVDVTSPDTGAGERFQTANKVLWVTPEGTPVYAPGTPVLAHAPGPPPDQVPNFAATTPPKQPPPSFIDQAVVNPAKDVASGIYTGAAGVSHLLANTFMGLDRAADWAASVTGTHKGEFFKNVQDWLTEQQKGAEQTAATLAGGPGGFRTDVPSQLYRIGGSAAAQLPAYALAATPAGPILGMAGLSALETADQGLTATGKAALTGALTGGMITVMGPASRAIRLVGTTAATYAQLRLAGVDHETALANALGMGGMAALPAGQLSSKETLQTAKQAIPDVPGNVIQALPEKVQRPLFPNRNPTERAAMQFFQDRGVPVNAAAASGSRFLKGVQKATEASPLGGLVAEGARQQTVEGIQNVAGQLLTEATPETSPDTFYQQFHAAADDPANARTVPTGEKDEQGKPISEDMQIPVPVGVLHKTFQPIFDDMQFMPMADRSRNAAYSALQILLSKDYVPARQAEIALSGIKQAIREGGGHQQALAKFVAPKLQGLIDRAVGDIAGEDTAKALQQGRISAATQAGADWLKQGFDEAMATGEFNRQDWLWRRWRNLNEEGKRTMFTPKQKADLDNFFLGAKKIFENVNPSGTAFVLAINSLLTGAGFAGGLPYVAGQLSTGSIAKLLSSKFGVRLLTEGLGSFGKDTPHAREISRQLQKIVGPQEPAKK